MSKRPARKPTGKQGPDSVRTAELAGILIEGLSDGVTLRQMCRELKLSKTAVYDWIDEDKDFAGRIARARARGFDQIAEQALEIADTCREGVKVKTLANGTTESQTGDMIERARLQVEARLKLLAKWDPKRYGEKVQHADANGNLLPAPEWHIHPTSPNA